MSQHPTRDQTFSSFDLWRTCLPCTGCLLGKLRDVGRTEKWRGGVGGGSKGEGLVGRCYLLLSRERTLGWEEVMGRGGVAIGWKFGSTATP